MYKISVEKDNEIPLMFLDSMTFIPALYEGCSRADEAKQETFVIRFNKHYAPIAMKVKVAFPGWPSPAPVILIPAVYDEKKMGDDPEPPQEISKADLKALIRPTIDQWRTIFKLNNTEIKDNWRIMIKKNFKIK